MAASEESISKNSWVEVELNAMLGKAVLISEGLGHGFLALEDRTAVVYLLSSPYAPQYEFEVNPLDKVIDVKWRLDKSDLIISEKDKSAPSLSKLIEEGMLSPRG